MEFLSRSWWEELWKHERQGRLCRRGRFFAFSHLQAPGTTYMGQSVLLLSWRAIQFPAWKLTSKIITSTASKSKVLDTHTHKNPWHVISTKSIQTPEILDRKKRKVYRERSTNPSHGVGHTGESTPETAPAATNTALSVPTHCVLAPMCDTEHDQGWGLSLPGSAPLGALGCANSLEPPRRRALSFVLLEMRKARFTVKFKTWTPVGPGPTPLSSALFP